MAKSKLTIIVGSLRKDSINLKLAKTIAELGLDLFESNFAQIDDLPLFNQDLETDFPASATRLKTVLNAADGILIVTPEYNRSMPGVLKNAIDWASRPYGTNSFAKKPVGIMGTSMGAIGTACSQHTLRPVLNYLDVILMGQPEVYFQYKKETFNTEETKKFLKNYVDQLAAWVERHRSDSTLG